jgi:exosortase
MSSPFLARCIAAAGAAAVVLGLVRYWLADYESADRGLILLAAAWAGARRWPAVAALPPAPRPWVGLLLVVIAGAAFLPPWFVFGQVGPRPILLWWEAVAVVLAAAGLLLQERGFAALHALRFPLLFPFLALPLPGRVNNPLQAVLQDWTTWLAAGGLSSLGVAVRRDGFLLTLPSGGLNVVEACSGVRSVTALVAIACFLAHLRGFGILRGLVTLALAVPVIVLVNALRVTTTGLLQEYAGRDAIAGWRHDALGFAMVLVGLVLVVAITGLLADRRQETGDRRQDTRPPSPVTCLESPVSSRIAAFWLAAVAVAAGALAAVPPMARSAPEPDLAAIPARFGDWVAGPDRPFDPDVARTLGTDNGLYRVYTRLGYEAHAWVMHWRSANGVRDYHHPDVCWPNRGFAPTERRVEPVVTPGGRTVPLTYREFARGKDRQIVVYWTQEGRHIWTEADERDAISPVFPLKWIARRFDRPDRDECDDRLAVLVGMDTWDGAKFGRAELLELTRRLAGAVFQTCPWAEPSQ